MPLFNTTGRKDIPNAVPNSWDLVAGMLMFSLLIALSYGIHDMVGPIQTEQTTKVSLALSVLPLYAFRSVLRMFIGIIISLVITFGIGVLAAKSRRAENIIIPSIDVLQSVPVLGYLNVVVFAFLPLFPGSMMGFECAALFAIVTAQVWNMIISFYQRLKTVPTTYYDVAQTLRLNAWQTFWRIEVPFALPSLIWNTMLSMSAGWFIVVAVEAIQVNGKMFYLPGLGSYLSVANAQGNSQAILNVFVAIFLVILIFDQLVFRPINHWIGRHQGEGRRRKAPWTVRLFNNANTVSRLLSGVRRWINSCTRWGKSGRISSKKRTTNKRTDLGLILYLLILAMLAWSLYKSMLFCVHEVPAVEFKKAILMGLITSVRVLVLILICTLIWTPIGVWIGLRPRVAEYLQPIIQFLASIPPNCFYSMLAMYLIHHQLTNYDIWLSPLLILGTQWYILFNVIAGVRSLPKNLLHASRLYQVTRWQKWKKLIIPGIFPDLITGMMTAAGGAWNATILAEVVNWDKHTLKAYGLGRYIVDAHEQGEMALLIMGIMVMCGYVLIINRLIWLPLFRYAEKYYTIEG